MSDRRSANALPTPSAEQRRIAGDNFDRARQVLVGGNHDYGIQLLNTCCKLEPGNMQFRQTLRHAQREKYKNNLKGSRFAFLTTGKSRTRLKAAKSGGDWIRVLDYGEIVLGKNPWDVPTQMDMAEAFDALGLIDLAVFSLDSARKKNPKDATLNRALARLFEKRGDFKKAIALWQMVKETNPADVEASHKAKDLAASETIARGGYDGTAAGTKESPILAQIDKRNAEVQDKPGRDTAALLKRIEADPTEPTLYTQVAAAYRKAGELARARAALQQGLGPTGNHFSLQLELLELDIQPFRRELEKTEATLKHLAAKPNDETAVDELPDEDELRKSKQKLQKEINTREIDYYRTKADRFPTDLAHRLELGQRLIKADLIDQAIAELQQARRDEQLKGRACMYLGACFNKRKNWRLAQRNFEEALQALPASDDAAKKEVLFQLATGSAQAGEKQRALDLGHELANLDYSYKGIGELLEEWEAPERAS